MLLGRCLHPPGSASALTAVFAHGVIHDLGYWFVLMPVALNAGILLLMAVIFNAPFKWRRYPSGWHKRLHVEIANQHEAMAISHEKFVKAVEELDTFIDVSEKDLVKLHNILYKSQA